MDKTKKEKKTKVSREEKIVEPVDERLDKFIEQVQLENSALKKILKGIVEIQNKELEKKRNTKTKNNSK